MITLADVLCTSLTPCQDHGSRERVYKSSVNSKIQKTDRKRSPYIASPLDAGGGRAGVDVAVEIDVIASFDALGVERASHGQAYIWRICNRITETWMRVGFSSAYHSFLSVADGSISRVQPPLCLACNQCPDSLRPLLSSGRRKSSLVEKVSDGSELLATGTRSNFPLDISASCAFDCSGSNGRITSRIYRWRAGL